jgi:hypothetical protein
METQLVAILMSIFSLFACTSKAEFKEGGIYATPQEGGKYSVLKILKIDDGGVHVRMYSNVHAAPRT